MKAADRRFIHWSPKTKAKMRGDVLWDLATKSRKENHRGRCWLCPSGPLAKAYSDELYLRIKCVDLSVPGDIKGFLKGYARFMNDITIIGPWVSKYILRGESWSLRHEDIHKVRLTYVFTHKAGEEHGKLGLVVSMVPPLALSWKRRRVSWRRDWTTFVAEPGEGTQNYFRLVGTTGEHGSIWLGRSRYRWLSASVFWQEQKVWQSSSGQRKGWSPIINSFTLLFREHRANPGFWKGDSSTQPFQMKGGKGRGTLIS